MALLTRSDLRTEVKKYIRKSNETQYDSLINSILNRVQLEYCQMYSWPFLEAKETIELIPEYTTGTVAISEGETALTGTGTTWTKAMTGRKIKLNSYREINKVGRFIGTTSITLANTYYGDDVTADSYSIFKDEYVCPIDWKEIKDIWIYDYHLKKEGIDIFRRQHMDSEPIDSDPIKWAPGQTRPLTRINVDGSSGTFTKDEFVTGANGAYGILKKASAYTAPTWFYLEILYGSFADNEQLTGDSSSATCNVNEPDGYNEGNLGGFLTIHLYPAPYRNILLECDVKKKAIDMDSDDDEPIIPIDHRNLLVNRCVSEMAKVLGIKQLASDYNIEALKAYTNMADDLISYQDRRVMIRPYNRRKEY